MTQPQVDDFDFPEGHLDIFRCPICWDVPVAEVFVCVNGHHVCGHCSTALQACPQCRVSFTRASSKIRCRVIEEFLDKVKLSCKYKQRGCPEWMTRKDFNNHVQTCIHNGTYFKLCGHLGYNCDFHLNTTNPLPALEHFKADHDAWTQERHHSKFLFLNLQDLDMAEVNRQSPSIIKLGNGPQHILVDIKFSADTVLCSSFFMGGSAQEAGKYRTKFFIENLTDKEAPYTWLLPPVVVSDLAREAPNATREGTYLQISTATLTEHCLVREGNEGHGCVEIQITIIDWENDLSRLQI